MSDPLIETMVTRLRPHVAADQVVALRTMLTYFGRSSLWVSRIEDSQDGRIEVLLASDTERFRVGLEEMLGWYQELRAGQRLDWDRLRRER
jgi:hypothetical protein